jgi:DNA-binding transcriptional LysR family regulator
VTRAAERLLVAQPALSKQLRALERQVGSRCSSGCRAAWR